MEEVLEEVLEEEPTILPQSRARPSPSGGQKTAKGLPISINLGSINYNGEVQNKGAIVGNVVGDGNTIIGSITTTVNYATSTANNLFKYTLKVREARTRFQAVLDRIQSTSSILSQICNLLEQKVRQIAAGSDIFRDICKEKTFCETLFTRVSRRVQEGTPIRERIEEGSKVTDEDRQKLAQLEQEIFLIGEEIDQCKEKFQLKLWTFTIAIETQKKKNPREQSDFQPIPAQSTLASRYAGWKLRKAKAHDPEAGPSFKASSWQRVVKESMNESTEQLFLQVTGQIAKRAKENHTLQDVYYALTSQNQRDAIGDLVSEQNCLLQSVDPRFEWKVAGIQPKLRNVRRYYTNTIVINVILKTEPILPGNNREREPRRIAEEFQDSAPLHGRHEGNKAASSHRNRSEKRPARSHHRPQKRRGGKSPQRSSSSSSGASHQGPGSKQKQHSPAHQGTSRPSFIDSSPPPNRPSRLIFVRESARPSVAWIEVQGNDKRKRVEGDSRSSASEIRSMPRIRTRRSHDRRAAVVDDDDYSEGDEEVESAVLKQKIEIENLVTKWNDAIEAI